MRGGEVVRRARSRAGLSLTALAERSALPVDQLACWEDGREEPTFVQVDELVRATGATLVALLSEPEIDPHDAALLDTMLALTVDERMQRLIAHVRFVEAGRAAVRAAR